MKSNYLIKWVLPVGIVVLLVFTGMFLYQFAGFRYYLRAVSYINNKPSEVERSKSWSDFVEPVSTDFYNGLYAGSFFGRVWVWGKTGLKQFKTTNYSTYTFFDGCTDRFLHPEKYNMETPVLAKEIFFDKTKWNKKVSLGDLIIITIGKNEIKGTLKEVYTYNYWPFLNTDQTTQCAK